ncbi:hypothetical protein TELCIR_10201 [Teladorsagia circumcincta]|uniref:Protein kinase domain-containing protein n=1 Tax=Teladorsagia circumcincta TaxID=45464 RepID=A0A2G9UCQ3_TELCI|nr:hypothetical protein TELCIR_10201 [Teladorsagia circumcincta]
MFQPSVSFVQIEQSQAGVHTTIAINRVFNSRQAGFNYDDPNILLCFSYRAAILERHGEASSRHRIKLSTRHQQSCLSAPSSAGPRMRYADPFTDVSINLSGTSFPDSRHHKGLGVRNARDYYRQLMRGVDFLHSIHVAHRDLKPDNLMINSNGLLKITDFGMATKLEMTCTNEEVPLDRMCGTRDYMSPQMFKKKYLSDQHFALWMERGLPRPFNRLTPGTLDILEYVLDVNEKTRPTSSEVLDHLWLAL